jgi:AcrR family transcriptional regulator
MPPRAKSKSPQETRSRLLQVAGRLFSEYGYKSVSLRQIADAAGVNSALIGYHFGGKQGLFAEAYKAHAAPINAERMRRLKELLDKGKPELQEVLDAWIRPSIVTGGKYRAQHVFIRLITVRTRSNVRFLERLAYETYGPVNEAFIDVLATCLPHLSRETLVWRFFFLIGSLLEPRLPGLRATMGGRDPGDMETMLNQLEPFIVQGFRAEDPVKRPSKKDKPERRTAALVE